jgi:hypothetical protein
MNLILHLTAETEERLKERASVIGKDPKTVALEAIEEKLAEESALLPQAASLAEFQAWLAAHPASATHALDDSRESIYDGRGQ